MEPNEGIGERLRTERVRLGLKQEDFAEAVKRLGAKGVTRQSQSLYEAGRRVPDAHYLQAVASLGVDVQYVVTGRRTVTRPSLSDVPAPGLEAAAMRSGAPAQPGLATFAAQADHPDLVQVPRYTLRASAGNGQRAEARGDELRGVFAFSAEWMRRHLGRASGGFASVTVSGDSMEPILRDGDEVVVDLVATGQHLADGVYIIALGDELRVKRLRMRMDGSVEVRGDNPAYAAEVLPPAAAEELRVIGRVVWPRIR